MADLDEMGYLEQPHTSAGRVPSYKGYRYFVDSLMQAEKLTPQEEQRLSKSLQQRLAKIDTVFYRASRALSEVSHYISLIMGPFLGQQIFRQLRLVPLDSQYVMVLLITDTGLVQNRIVEIPAGVSAAELDQIARLFTKLLAGVPLEDLTSSLLQELYTMFSRRNRFLQEFFADLITNLAADEGERVYLGGTTNLLKHPEFNDMERYGVTEAIGRTGVPLQPLGRYDLEEDIEITIGEENKYVK